MNKRNEMSRGVCLWAYPTASQEEQFPILEYFKERCIIEIWISTSSSPRSLQRLVIRPA